MFSLDEINLKKAFATVFLAVLPPLLLVSETSLKSMIEDWFATCTIIIDVGDGLDKKDIVPVKLFVQEILLQPLR